MVGLAGVVAGLVFVSSLDRLIASPARSAIPFDVQIADVTEDDLEGEVLDQPARRRRVRSWPSAPLVVDGLDLERARGRGPARARSTSAIEEGRLPTDTR